jgi:hypothetical protein
MVAGVVGEVHARQGHEGGSGRARGEAVIREADVEHCTLLRYGICLANGDLLAQRGMQLTEAGARAVRPHHVSNRYLP